MKEKKQIIRQIEEQEEFANYLQDKIHRYKLWKLFVLNDIKSLKKRLIRCK